MGTRRAFTDAFKDPKILWMCGLGFSAGLPNPLAGDTLSGWLDDVGVSLTAVALFGAVHLPYNFKFAWAWLLDRYPLPFLSRRRGWIFALQIALFAGIGALGHLDPVRAPWYVAALAFVIAFGAASQDILVDAYRTELLAPEQRASGVALFVMFYRLALICAGPLAFILADQVSWTVVFWVLGALLLLGAATTYFAPAAEVEPAAPASLTEAVIEPFREFAKREQAWLMLSIVLLYKFGDVVVGQLRTPFLRDVGFTLTEIGGLGKIIGLVATIVGALLGGGLVAKWSLKKAMIVFGIAQALPNLTYAALAYTGHNYALLALGYGVDNFMGGMGTTALIAFLMMLCDARYTAMQYALFTSLMTVPGRLFGLGSGWLAEQVGWPALWLISVVLALPAIILLTRARFDDDDEPGPVESPKPTEF